MAITKILTPTDFSEAAQAAFLTAHELAEQLGATLFLVHVRDEGTLRTAVSEGMVNKESTDQEIAEGVRHLIEMRFSAMMAGLALPGLPIRTEVRTGEPGSVIVETANDLRADLIVMGLNGVTAMGQVASLLLGSVCQHVMRNSPCPTVIVRVDQRPRS
ncbi:MAG TPA: universal stress protein [Blastocatellia bacterium]|nr:universal stress protein [Blastocatellia bacterium]